MPSLDAKLNAGKVAGEVLQFTMTGMATLIVAGALGALAGCGVDSGLELVGVPDNTSTGIASFAGLATGSAVVGFAVQSGYRFKG
ncbi:MAG: hypothetical protein AAB439_01765 [Patescibacteria group bacterium]